MVGLEVPAIVRRREQHAVAIQVGEGDVCLVAVARFADKAEDHHDSPASIAMLGQPRRSAWRKCYTLWPLVPPAQPLQGRRILVIDDQPSIRGVLQVALEEAGADVWTAGDGASALVILESALPDLVLLDLVMPGMDGWEVVRLLKANYRTSQLPVILETSAQDYLSYAAARKEGIAAFLGKPFRLNEVIETCRRVLDGARPMQGKPSHAEEGHAPDVQVRDPSGKLMGIGKLLDLAPRGAQIEMDKPLAQTVPYTVTLTEPEGARLVTGDLRWVRKVGNHFHHGFSLREE